MSTLRLSFGVLILMLLLGLVGCSSTSGLRTAARPKMRTIASIGDKPLPVVTGEPGDAEVAASDPPERVSRVDSEGRVSGRVFDEQGEPVANVRVRLAVGPTQGGRVVRATTDRGGGFTLRGLRPGTSYTVIAEGEDDQGPLIGRSNVEAPDSDVRIALTSADAEVRDLGASTPVKPVSRRGATDEEAIEEEVAEVVGSPINVEDLPPAPEADQITPARGRRVRGESVNSASSPDEPSFSTTRGGSWRRLERSTSATSSSDVEVTPRSARDDAPEPSFVPRPVRESEGSDAPAPADDEGPNPLPPALEPGQARRSSPRNDLPIAEAPASLPPLSGMTLVKEDEPPALPDTTPPGALVALPRASEPAETVQVAATFPPPADLPPPVEEAGSALPAGPVVASDALLPPPIELAPTPVEPAGPVVASDALLPPPVEGVESARGQSPLPPAQSADESRPRPKWRDLAAAGVAHPPPAEESKETIAAGDVGDPKMSRVVRGSPRETEVFCRFDPKLRRIEDFRLPDLQGRPVRFQDLDTDLVLLDFWGTWCQPCVKSIPHLVDLQKRLGGKQLQVVGIACERPETPPAQRAAGVAKAAQKLGINYPVLVSSMDGTCPLQKALHVQAFPTLILVDRQGRILWQDQGATRVTMARLDRMLNLAIKSDDRRRY